jgi:large subunit ribosomal protein L10
VLTRAQKEEQVAELKDKLGRAKCIYVADYRGLDVAAVNELRGRIRKEGAGEYEYRVAKNTLLRLAVAGSDLEGLAGHFQGPTVVAISFGDPVGLAKILTQFAKDHEALRLRGGLLEGQTMAPAQIETLAGLPGLDSLRAALIGLIQAPATKLVRLISEPGAQLARVVAARGRGEGSAGGATSETERNQEPTNRKVE